MSKEIKGDKTLILELVDRQRSNFELEGSRDEGNAIFLDGPSARHIRNTSHMIVDKKYVAIRYIKGSHTIIVSEQEAQNIKPNPSEDRIWFPGTELTVSEKGRDTCLLKFLSSTADNADAPNRPDDHPAIFREIRAEEIATDDIKVIRLREKAQEIVKELYTEQGDEFVFDSDRLGTLALIFGMVDVPTDAEKLRAVYTIAHTNPAYFLESIANKTKSYRVAILESINLNVLSIDKGSASLVNDKKAFLQLKTDDKEKKIEKLINHFLSTAGGNDYKQMVIQLEAAKAMALTEQAT